MQNKVTNLFNTLVQYISTVLVVNTCPSSELYCLLISNDRNGNHLLKKSMFFQYIPMWMSQAL